MLALDAAQTWCWVAAYCECLSVLLHSCHVMVDTYLSSMAIRTRSRAISREELCAIVMLLEVSGQTSLEIILRFQVAATFEGFL